TTAPRAVCTAWSTGNSCGCGRWPRTATTRLCTSPRSSRAPPRPSWADRPVEAARTLETTGAHDRRGRRWPRVLISAGVVVLVLVLVAGACAVTVYNRVDRLSTALDQTTRSAYSLFDTLLTDPAAADAALAVVPASQYYTDPVYTAE